MYACSNSGSEGRLDMIGSRIKRAWEKEFRLYETVDERCKLDEKIEIGEMRHFIFSNMRISMCYLVYRKWMTVVASWCLWPAGRDRKEKENRGEGVRKEQKRKDRKTDEWQQTLVILIRMKCTWHYWFESIEVITCCHSHSSSRARLLHGSRGAEWTRVGEPQPRHIFTKPTLSYYS